MIRSEHPVREGAFYGRRELGRDQSAGRILVAEPLGQAAQLFLGPAGDHPNRAEGMKQTTLDEKGDFDDLRLPFDQPFQHGGMEEGVELAAAAWILEDGFAHSISSYRPLEPEPSADGRRDGRVGP